MNDEERARYGDAGIFKRTIRRWGDIQMIDRRTTRQEDAG